MQVLANAWFMRWPIVLVSRLLSLSGDGLIWIEAAYLASAELKLCFVVGFREFLVFPFC